MNFYKRAKITHMPIVSEQFLQIQFRKKKKFQWQDNNQHEWFRLIYQFITLHSEDLTARLHALSACHLLLFAGNLIAASRSIYPHVNVGWKDLMPINGHVIHSVFIQVLFCFCFCALFLSFPSFSLCLYLCAGWSTLYQSAPPTTCW